MISQQKVGKTKGEHFCSLRLFSCFCSWTNWNNKGWIYFLSKTSKTLNKIIEMMVFKMILNIGSRRRAFFERNKTRKLAGTQITKQRKIPVETHGGKKPLWYSS
jgi:hypothetical protein